MPRDAADSHELQHSLAASRGPAAPRSLGGYLLVQELARGGMGVVYEARKGGTGRPVALKVLLERALQDPEVLLRFREETRVVSGLTHPNLVTVLDAGTDRGHPFLVMDLVAGGSLIDRLRGGPLAPADAVRCVAGAARGLAYVHAHGVLHRDVKPHNVLLDLDGRARLADFGLAKVLHARAVSLPRSAVPERSSRRARAGQALRRGRRLPDPARGDDALGGRDARRGPP